MIGYPIDWQPASDDGAGFGRHADMSDAALDAEVAHERHGRGDEDGPYEPDCGCRTTSEQYACADAGCGFCGAAQPLQDDAPTMEAGGLLMMPPDAEQDTQSHSDATGVA